MLSTCGQSFCEGCFNKSDIINRDKCPYCQQQDFKVFPDKRALRQVLDLQVYCPNKKGGCEWSHKLRALEKHLEECPQAVVECPYDIVGCQSVVRRAEKLNHLKEMAEQHMEYNLSASLGNQRELQCTKQQLKATEEELKRTQNQLEETNQSLEGVKQAMEAKLQAKEQEIADVKKDLVQLKEFLTVKEREIAENKEKHKEIVTRLDNQSRQLENEIEKLVTVQYYTIHKNQATWSILLNTLATASESGKQVLPVIVRMNGFLWQRKIVRWSTIGGILVDFIVTMEVIRCALEW